MESTKEGQKFSHSRLNWGKSLRLGFAVLVLALVANAYVMASQSLTTTGQVNISGTSPALQITGGSINGQSCTVLSTTTLSCPTVTLGGVGQSTQISISVNNTGASSIAVSASASTNQPTVTMTPSSSNPTTISAGGSGTFTFTILVTATGISGASYTVNITG